jgi:hypothetical protein
MGPDARKHGCRRGEGQEGYARIATAETSRNSLSVAPLAA